MMLMMMYTGASRRAFQLAVAHEVEPKACTRRLWLPLYGPCVISEHEEMRLRLVIFIVVFDATNPADFQRYLLDLTIWRVLYRRLLIKSNAQ